MAELREADGGGAGMVRGGRRQRGWNQGVSPRSLVLYTVAEGAVVRLGLGARVSATGSLSRAPASSFFVEPGNGEARGGWSELLRAGVHPGQLEVHFI